MEFKSTDSQAVEKALKDLVKQWDTEDYEKVGREFVKQLNLDCKRESGTYIDQVKKRLKRDPTPEEERILKYFYRTICLANIGAYLVEPVLDRYRLRERISQSKERFQRVEEEIRRIQLSIRFSQPLELQRAEQELGRAIEELQEIEEELRNSE